MPRGRCQPPVEEQAAAGMRDHEARDWRRGGLGRAQQHTHRVVAVVGHGEIGMPIPVEVSNRYPNWARPHGIGCLRPEGDRIRRQSGRDCPEGRCPTEAAHPRCQEQCRRQASCHACPVHVHLSSRPHPASPACPTGRWLAATCPVGMAHPLTMRAAGSSAHRRMVPESL